MSNKIIVAGPCSAESFHQLENVFRFLSEFDEVKFVRAGVWKPRTRPNAFEGKGEEALQWIKEIQKLNTEKSFMIEVANPEQLELALKYEIKNFWIGARTSVNPFTVQEIADASKGLSDIQFWVKNPMHPDVNLWLGAIERFEKAGINRVNAIHRGFFVNNQNPFRNDPNWAIPMQLKTIRKDLEIICDVSHIAGKRNLIQDLTATALWLNFDGIMAEVHPNPAEALTDKDQQLSLEDFNLLLNFIKNFGSMSSLLPGEIVHYRSEIDKIDFEIIKLLFERMKLAERIGEIKSIFQIPVFQPERWQEILSSRPAWAEQSGLTSAFIEKMWELIHNESINIQNQTIKATEKNASKKSV